MKLSCGEFRACWDQRLDGVLAGAAAAAFEEHRADCARCAADWASYSRAVSLVRALPRAAAPAGFASAVMGRLAQSEPGPARRRIAFPFSLKLAAGVLVAVTLGLLFSRVSPLRDAAEGGRTAPAASRRSFGAAPEASSPAAVAGEKEAEAAEWAGRPTGDDSLGVIGAANPAPADGRASEPLLKSLRDDDAVRLARQETEIGSLGYVASADQRSRKLTEGFAAPPAPGVEANALEPGDATVDVEKRKDAEEESGSGEVAFLSRDAVGRDVVLVPRPEAFDRVLFLDPDSGRLADLRAERPEYKLANNFRPVPPVDGSPSAQADFFLGSSASSPPPASSVLAVWTQPIPSDWQSLPIDSLTAAGAAVGGGGKKGGDAGDARFAGGSDGAPASGFRVYSLEIEPDQVASRIGRLWGELQDAGGDAEVPRVGEPLPEASPTPDPATAETAKSASAAKSAGGARGTRSDPASGGAAAPGRGAPKPAASAPGTAGGAADDAPGAREKARDSVDKNDRRPDEPQAAGSADRDRLDRRQDGSARVRILLVVPVPPAAPKLDEKK